MEEIALALKAIISLSLNPLLLLTWAEQKHGDYLQSYMYRQFSKWDQFGIKKCHNGFI